MRQVWVTECRWAGSWSQDLGAKRGSSQHSNGPLALLVGEAQPWANRASLELGQGWGS